MFEPDGRNSIQTVGHTVSTVLKWICWVVGFIACLPTLIYFYSKAQMEFQERTISAYNRDMPMQAILVDFGTPDLTGLQRALREGAEKNLPGGKSIIYTTLPFTVTRLEAGQGPADQQVWRPVDPKRDRQFGPLNDEDIVANGNTWVYKSLPYAEGQIGWWGKNSSGNRDPWYTDILKERISWDYDLNSIQARDYWLRSGAFKLTPTRWWDTHSGEEQLFAKASYNYRAYVIAARAASAMRYWAAVRKAGKWVYPEALWRSTIPGGILIQHAEDQGFERNYRTVFAGKLPKVVMHLQGLGDPALEDTPRLKAYKGSVETMAGSYYVDLWPFVTGMYLDDGSLKPKPKAWGRPEWSRWDFLVNSKPSLNDQAVEAQKALLRLGDPTFWKPLFIAEGLTDADTLTTIDAVLTRIRKDVEEDARWCRRWNYRVYHYAGARFEL